MFAEAADTAGEELDDDSAVGVLVRSTVEAGPLLCGVAVVLSVDCVDARRAAPASADEAWVASADGPAAVFAKSFDSVTDGACSEAVVSVVVV